MRASATKHEMEVMLAEAKAADRRRNADPIYKAQTGMLQHLRRNGHAVDFANNPIFTPELPGSPARYIGTELILYDGKPCPFCGHTMRIGSPRPPSRDHLKPRSRGGTFAKGNKLIVCRPCNHDKGDRTLREWLERLVALEDPRAGLVQNLIDRGG
jgi:5-methylcytosine-specific restriction endonuclease McrA